VAYITRHKSGWRAAIDRKGVRESKILGTRAEAQDWAYKREAEIMSGAFQASRETFCAAADHLESSTKLGRSEITRLGYFRTLSWASKPLRDLSPSDFSAWRNTRLQAVKPGSVIREMTIIRRVLEHARRDLGWLQVNPLADVKRPPQPAHRDRLITDAERDAIVATLGYADKVENVRHEAAIAFLLALETGMRAGEIVGLEWGRVRKRAVRLVETKNGTARDVPLSTRAAELIGQMRGRRLSHIRKPVNPARVFHIGAPELDALFRRARTDAGLSGFTFHDSRHTAVTRLAGKLDLLELGRMIGHTDLNSLRIYFNAPAEQIAAKLD